MRTGPGSVIALAALVAAGSAAEARTKQPSLREQQEHFCANDAMTLCRDAVPDEARITACMRAKKAQLSPECAKMFETDAKARK